MGFRRVKKSALKKGIFDILTALFKSASDSEILFKETSNNVTAFCTFSFLFEQITHLHIELTKS